VLYWWSPIEPHDVCWWYLRVLSKCTWVAKVTRLDVCQAYAESHGMTFNCSKTVCMTFETSAKSTVIPLLTLDGQSVKSVIHYKYLGIILDQRFPTWGTRTPRGIFPIRRGTFEVSNRREICIYISFISKYLYMYQWILFSKAIICFFLNISVINHDKIFCYKKFQGYMFICRNAEGVHPHLSVCWRGTWSEKGWEPLY